MNEAKGMPLTPAWIGMGSNIGDRGATLSAAVASLRGLSGVVVKQVSRFYETKPVGGPTGQGAFLNAAVHVETTLNADALLRELLKVEKQAGRVREVHWGARTLDLDLLIYDARIIRTPTLQVPHPRLAFRRFVLEPMAEIAPHIVDLHTKMSMATLLANLNRKPHYLAIHGEPGPLRTYVFDQLVERLPALGLAEREIEGLAETAPGVLPGPLRAIRRKASVLNQAQWEREALRVPWLVTDFCFWLDGLRASTMHVWNTLHPDDTSARYQAHREWLVEFRQRSNEMLQPTLILNLPQGEQAPRRIGFLRTPQLCPISRQVDEILDEVVATCQGIDRA